MGATSVATSVQSTACGVVTEPLINSASPPHAWEAKCKMHSAKKNDLALLLVRGGTRKSWEPECTTQH